MKLAVYRQHAAAAMQLLAEHGWHPFGTHVDQPDVELQFSDQLDDDGLPYFERVRTGELRLGASLGAMLAVVDAAERGEYAAKGRDFGRGVAYLAAELRAALASAARP